MTEGAHISCWFGYWFWTSLWINSTKRTSYIFGGMLHPSSIRGCTSCNFERGIWKFRILNNGGSKLINSKLIGCSKTSIGTNKSTYKCIHYNMIGHTKSHCYELVGYLEWWDHSRKKNLKRTSIVVTVEIKIENDVAKKASTLVAETNNGVRF